jgi:hypothetical protein
MEYIDKNDYIFNTDSDDKLLQFIHSILLFIFIYLFVKLTFKVRKYWLVIPKLVILLYFIFSLLLYYYYLTVATKVAIFIRSNLVYSI